MRVLLDTCIISELSKKAPAPCGVKWISDVDENNLFISALTIGEIYKGIKKSMYELYEDIQDIKFIEDYIETQKNREFITGEELFS